MWNPNSKKKKEIVNEQCFWLIEKRGEQTDRHTHTHTHTHTRYWKVAKWGKRRGMEAKRKYKKVISCSITTMRYGTKELNSDEHVFF